MYLKSGGIPTIGLTVLPSPPTVYHTTPPPSPPKCTSDHSEKIKLCYRMSKEALNKGYVLIILRLIKERVHLEMKMSSNMRFNLLIMPIVLIFFQSLSLAVRKGYGKIM